LTAEFLWRSWPIPNTYFLKDIKGMAVGARSARQKDMHSVVSRKFVGRGGTSNWTGCSFARADMLTKNIVIAFFLSMPSC
jgi:hypothetical protein